MEKVVIALGGNALQGEGSNPTADAQLKTIKETITYIANIIEDGYKIVLTHGNGPQIGRILIQNEAADKITPSMPFDICGAMSQGMIGYHLQQALGDELKSRGIKIPVSTIVTQVVVDKDDPGFNNPTKPIGPFYRKEDAEKFQKEKGYSIVEDSGRGYRRVVASPEPKRIVELETIKTLIENDNIVIAVGGGGIPVIEEKGSFKGVAAVIDKDLASGKLAENIDADILIILTAVEKVFINFGKKDQRGLDEVGVDEVKRYVEEGHFAPGSMLPKVLAGIRFVESRPGRNAIITSLDMLEQALNGKSGTTIKKI